MWGAMSCLWRLAQVSAKPKRPLPSKNIFGPGINPLGNQWRRRDRFVYHPATSKPLKGKALNEIVPKALGRFCLTDNVLGS